MPTSVSVSRRWRIAGWLVLSAVLALGFWSYLSPDMAINWENIAALCGLGRAPPWAHVGRLPH